MDNVDSHTMNVMSSGLQNLDTNQGNTTLILAMLLYNRPYMNVIHCTYYSEINNHLQHISNCAY